MDDISAGGYREFLLGKRIRINRYLNIALWCFVIAGPAIAAGIKGGVFHNIAYSACAVVSVAVIIMSAVHLLLTKKYPSSLITCLFALTALDVLIVYMAYSHMSIHMTWFIVPMLSLLFCDIRIYTYALVLNYFLMFFTTLKSAAFHASVSSLYSEPAAWFVDAISAYTIETIAMGVSGFMIVILLSSYFKELFSQSNMIADQKNTMDEKMKILDSMAEIYDNVNLLDFVNNTETSLRDPEQKTYHIDMPRQTHTLMNQRLKEKIAPDQLEAFLTFTNITTVVDRLTNKKLISADFIDMTQGWFRAQYITSEAGEDGKPTIAIYTTRNVDEERRREEWLMRISMTDELTKLLNRRCYDNDLAKYRDNPPEDDFVLFSIDVNGLKQVNDTKGHAAGDELICGAADCIRMTLGEKGKIYRTGGDEFMISVHTDDPEKLRAEFMKNADEWHGEHVDRISLSVGYASYRANSGSSVVDLERIAEADMYKEKERYYRESGLDRRRRNA